ncbi:MAG TPA: EamA family transporter [Candidatus Limnocylindria bacterium]
MQYIAFVACCLIWGSTFLAIRIGNQSLPPEWAATMRLTLAAPLLALIVVVRRDPWPRGKTLLGAVLFGALNFGANLALLYWGERVVPSGIAAVLYATVPLSTAFLAAAFGVEHLNARKVIAAIVAIAGVATIFAGETQLDVPFNGLLAVFFAATFASLSSIVLKRYPQPSAFATNSVGAAAGAVICLSASVLLGEDRAIPTTLPAIWPVIYLTLAGSLGAYVIFTWLVTHWSVTNASYVGVVVPVIAVILGALVLQETRAAETYLGAAIVVAAVVVALRGGASAH